MRKMCQIQLVRMDGAFGFPEKEIIAHVEVPFILSTFWRA